MKLPQLMLPLVCVLLIYVGSYFLLSPYASGDGGGQGRIFVSRIAFECYYPVFVSEQALRISTDKQPSGFIAIYKRDGASLAGLAYAVPFFIPLGIAWHYARRGQISIRNLLALTTAEAVALAACRAVMG
jgi:hypothetical protein